MIIIGHRGAKGLAPENTLDSIEAGLKNQVDAIEIDVRVTGDNIPVLCHDNFLQKDAYKHVISKSEFRQLKNLFPEIVTLDETLRYVKGKKLTIVEIKPGENLAPIIDCLKNRLNNEWQYKDLRVASFDFRILKKVKSELPDIILVVNEKWSGVRANYRCQNLGTAYAAINQKWLWSGFIASFSRSGKKLSAYPLNDPAKAKKWAKHGLYAVITDFPDRFKD